MSDIEKLETLVDNLVESGFTISKDVLIEKFNQHPEHFNMAVTWQGKKELEDSTLYFNKGEDGNYSHMEIREKNFDFLANQALDAEMPAEVLIKLRAEMEKGLPEIQIEALKTVKNLPTRSTLQYSYYPQNGFYYWNNYDFQIMGLPADNLAGQTQKVFIDNKDWANNYTPTEMVGLLTGQTIQKELVSAEGKYYVTKKKLDFSTVDKYGNFAKVNPEAVSQKNQQGTSTESGLNNKPRNSEGQREVTRRPPRRGHGKGI